MHACIIVYHSLRLTINLFLLAIGLFSSFNLIPYRQTPIISSPVETETNRNKQLSPHAQRKPSPRLTRIPSNTSPKHIRKIQSWRLLPSLRSLRSLSSSPLLHPGLGRERRKHLLGFRARIFPEILMCETLLCRWSRTGVQCEKR